MLQENSSLKNGLETYVIMFGHEQKVALDNVKD